MNEKNVINRDESYRFLHILLDIGEEMFCSGAEINRIEENLTKIGTAYALKELNVFVIPSMISVTMRSCDGFELTQTRRVKPKNVSVNLHKLAKLNDISHRCRDNNLSLDELRLLISESNTPIPFARFLLGSILAATSFTVFFGGKLLDAVISALLAVFVCFLQRKISVFLSNRIIFNFICTLLIGLIAGFASRLLIPFSMDKVIIGTIMLLVPGVGLTVSIRDIILEDTISGVLRLVESLFLTGGLALGIFVSFLILGG